MNNKLKKVPKVRTWWIALIQYMFLFYYLSYSNTLINNHIILISCCLILFVEIALRKKISYLLCVAFFASGWAFFCSFINGSGYGSALTQTTLLILVCLLSEMQMDKRQRKKIVFRMAFILFTILILFSKRTKYGSYFIPIAPYFPNDVQINPNCIAILSFFLLVFLFEIIEDTSWKNRYKKGLELIFAVISTFYIYMTSARTSILALVIFLVLFYFVKYKNRNNVKIGFYVGLCLTLVVVFVYIGLYKSGFMVDDTFLDKEFYSGRQTIWSEAVNMVIEQPLFGFSNKIGFGSEDILSVHNSLLAILCYFGIIGLGSTLTVLFVAFKRIDYSKQRIITSALFSVLIIMCFETLITDWSLILPFCLLFIQTKTKKGATK